MPTILRGANRIIPATSSHGGLRLTLTSRNDIVTVGSSTPYIQGDSNMAAIVPDVTDTAWDITVSATHFGRRARVSLSCSATGSIAGNRLTRVSDGSCNILASTGMYRQSQVVTMERSAPAPYNQWQSFVAGSLAADIQDTTDVPLPFWSGSGFGFTAISPRHVIGCEHIYYMPPTLTLGGVARNLVDVAYIGPSILEDNYATDLMVGLYDGDFPSFVKVFPADLYDYLPSLQYNPPTRPLQHVPAFVCNQFGQRLRRYSGQMLSSLRRISLEKISPLDTDIIGGDSGNPAFFVVDGEPVLLGPLNGAGGGGVTAIHENIAGINAAMTTLGGGYQLTQLDLSGYPTY